MSETSPDHNQMSVSDMKRERPLISRGLSYVVRQGGPLDLVPLMQLTELFFQEAGWKEHTDFNEIVVKEMYENVLNDGFAETGQCIYILDAMTIPQGGTHTQIPVGFIKFGINCNKTTDPMGVLDAVYVLPKFRLSAAGRLLFAAAESRLRALGAWCFLAAPGARMAGVDKSMANMLEKLGFEVECIRAVKILKESET